MTTADVWKLNPAVQPFLTYRAALPLAQEQLGVMLALLSTRPEPVRRFMDIGCGDGVLGATVLGQYPQSQGVLLDFSAPMLEQARKNLAHAANQVTLLDLDYGDPAWVNVVREHGPFDAIVSGFSIHHQTDERKREIYTEIFNLLAPGGWFINVEHVASAAVTSIDLFENFVIDQRYAIDQKSGGSQTRDQIAADFHSRPDKAANILAPTETQCQWLREIGYQEVDCYFKIYELAVFAGKKS